VAGTYVDELENRRPAGGSPDRLSSGAALPPRKAWRVHRWRI